MDMTLTSPLAVQQRDEDLALVARGDPRAVVSLYRQHARDLYRFIARRIHGPIEDVEEILQDTMLAAVGSAPNFRGECSVRTWLCGIARKQILQRHRTEMRKKRIPASLTLSMDEASLEWLQCASLDGRPIPVDVAESLAVRETVQKVLDQLEEEYREALLLRYVDEFSIRDIAQILNKTERAAEGLVRRARQRAREIGAQYL